MSGYPRFIVGRGASDQCLGMAFLLSGNDGMGRLESHGNLVLAFRLVEASLTVSDD